MQDTVATSWRRFSDAAGKHADPGSTGRPELPSIHVHEHQLATWEDEGGRSAICAETLRVLIVDNDIRASDAVELMLHAAGYSQTRVAYSAQAALAIAAVFRPSVVLVELDLLELTGYEVARLLREHAQSDDLRLIALTSSREHADRELARVAGFERYLLKPVAALELLQLLQTPGARDRGSRARRLR